MAPTHRFQNNRFLVRNTNMKIMIILLTALTLLGVGASHGGETCSAESAGQGLEGLTGKYGATAGEPVEAKISADGFMSNPSSVLLRLSGHLSLGLRRCGDNDPQPVELYEFTATLMDTVTGRRWLAVIQVKWIHVGDSGDFDVRVPFRPSGGDWSYSGLSPEQLRLELVGRVVEGPNCEDLSPYSEAIVSGASLYSIRLANESSAGVSE